MNGNLYKTLTNKNITFIKKINNNHIQVKKPIKIIYRNKNNILPDNFSNSNSDLKNNGFSLFQNKTIYKNKKNIGKEVNANTINKKIFLLKGTDSKKGFKSNSHYNIMTTPHMNNNNYNDDYFKEIPLAKVTKINNSPSQPKHYFTKPLNKNNLYNNYRSFNNINYRNNLNQLYNLNLINKTQIKNNFITDNNILTEQNLINNNYLTMPRVNDNSQILQMSLDNSQNIIDNDDEQRTTDMTDITDLNRFSVNNDINLGGCESERLATGFQLYNIENNLSNELANNDNNSNTLPNNYYIDNYFNNNLNLNSFQANQNEFQNTSLNDIINQLTNNHQNVTYNNYIENLNNNYNINPYIRLLNNYTQNRRNNGNKNDILLKDYGALTRPGAEEGLPKINQDAFIEKTNINGINDFNIFGVLDGHGSQGHYISEFASEFIPNKIITHKEIKNNTNKESIYNKLIEDDYKIIKEAFISTDKELDSLEISSLNSGTTCNIIIHIGNHLICANVGDSRSLVVFDEQNDNDLNFLRAIPLSIDYKPELPEENSRILYSGGVVKQLKNEFGEYMGPYRVYAPGKDYPGLAMSRSIGDLFAKKLGVISEPGINEYYIGNNTKFFVLCSDGVWEFLSNDKVRDIGKQFYLNSNASEFCQELISRSLIEWQTHDIIVDDITAVAAFF